MAVDAQSGRSIIAHFAAVSHEPEWFLQVRQNALDAGLGMPFPQWDRTDASQFPLLEHKPAALQRVFADDAVALLDEKAQAAGVVFKSLFEALHSDEDKVRAYFGTVVPPQENRFIAAHYALVNAGTFVYVPANVEIELPLRVHHSVDTEDQGMHLHTLVIAEQGARVTLVETQEGPIANSALHTHVVEVVTGAGSAVQFVGTQNFSYKSSSYAFRRCVLEQDASIEWVICSFGGRLAKDASETILKGNGSQARGMAIFFAQGTQHFDTEVNMKHTGLHTTSDILARGVAGSESRGVYRALTHIAHGARFTSAYQRANTLLLSSAARADAIPALTIDEDEVQAGHAATVGQVDEDQLFYLMSRGLRPSEALQIIVSGFFDPVLQRVPLEETKAAMQQLIDKKATL